MTKEELDKIIAKMTPSERSEFMALLAAEKREPVFKDAAFAAQTAFLEDPARMKVVLCTRRSGKSYGAGLMLMREAYSQPNVSCLYVALTRASAKRIMWKDVLKTIDREQGIGCRFNETELSMTLPNGSIIYLLGMDADEQEKDKALGQKFKAIVIDEAASYGVDLHEMVYGILKPATADYRGTIAMIGTPGNMKRGLFYELTRGQVPSEAGRWEKMGWSGHRWTAFDNPHMAEKWKAEIEDLKLANPMVEETPLFQQHYLGKWVVDDSNLVYRFDYERNSFDELPVMKTNAGRWHYVLGIDLGFNDPTAWVVCAYHDFDRTLYVLGAHKKAKCDITEVADQTHKLMGRFDFDSIIIDNANKQAVEEMRRRHDIPLTPASKTGKSDFIEIMNGELMQGRIKLHKKAAAVLMDEYGQLIWDERSPRREEHPGCDNHACFADGTMIITRRGSVPVEHVTSNDWVLTRSGWCPVEWCIPTGEKPLIRADFNNGKSLIGTPEHPVWTENCGWSRLDSLTASDVFVTSEELCENTQKARQKQLSGTAKRGDVGPSRLDAVIESILSGTPFGFIGRFGNFITDLFPKATTFTIATTTPATTTFATWNAYQPQSIIANTLPTPLKNSRPSDERLLRLPSFPPLNGTHHQKGENGIASTLKRWRQAARILMFNARSAVFSSKPAVLTARFAVERVTPAGTARVWALKVSGRPEYFANGVLVHNCDAALYAWRHCYQYLSDMRQSNGLRYGHSEEDWMVLQEQRELEKMLEERKNREAELALYGDPLDDYLSRH
jgi:PBSX family phage terminase large subunit